MPKHKGDITTLFNGPLGEALEYLKAGDSVRFFRASKEIYESDDVQMYLKGLKDQKLSAVKKVLNEIDDFFELLANKLSDNEEKLIDIFGSEEKAMAILGPINSILGRKYTGGDRASAADHYYENKSLEELCQQLHEVYKPLLEELNSSQSNELFGYSGNIRKCLNECEKFAEGQEEEAQAGPPMAAPPAASSS